MKLLLVDLIDMRLLLQRLENEFESGSTVPIEGSAVGVLLRTVVSLQRHNLCVVPVLFLSQQVLATV